MKKYEIMYILKANLNEEARNSSIEKIHAILTSKGAKITKVDQIGLRDFAFLIKDEPKGFYVVIKVSADEAALQEFERLARINPDMLRYLVTVDKD